MRLCVWCQGAAGSDGENFLLIMEEFGADCMDTNHKFLPASLKYAHGRECLVPPVPEKVTRLHLHRVEMSCCNWRHYSSFARQYSDSDSQLLVNRVGHGWFHSLISDCCCCSASKSCPALWPRGLQHCRLPCPSSVMDNHSSRLVKAPSLWFSFIDKSTHSELPKRAAAITKVLALATMLFSDHIVSDASPR